jgi:hypothetical protein
MKREWTSLYLFSITNTTNEVRKNFKENNNIEKCDVWKENELAFILFSIFLFFIASTTNEVRKTFKENNNIGKCMVWLLRVLFYRGSCFLTWWPKVYTSVTQNYLVQNRVANIYHVEVTIENNYLYHRGCLVSPARCLMAFFICLLVLGSRHLVFDSGLLGNSDVLVFVRDSRVRDWLLLGKVLAPIAHLTWGKLLRDLMWFLKKLTY